jgi:aarF domain-containing kinase
MQMPQLPQLPSVQFPDLQLPQGGGPSVLEGITSSISASSDALSQLPQQTQQQLQLLLAQLQELNIGNSTLQPHFGTQALLTWLQGAVDTLGSSLQSAADSLSFSTPTMPIDITSTPVALGNMSSSILGGISATLSTQGFAGVGAAAKANMQALAASLQVLSASAAAQLPTDVSSSLSQGASTVQEQAAAVTSSAQQLQEILLQVAQTLQHLPETGAGGYSFPTLCLVAAGALAAAAASVPPADAVAGGKDDASARDLTHEYDPAAVEAYFKRRPVLVAQRSLQLAVEMAGFGLNLLGDFATNRVQVRGVH